MLNIGRLSAGAADYYLGEVASSPESYYLGHGEAAGRWVGSLAEHLGLRGQVGEAEFKALLDGCHPKTGEQLLSSRGSAGRSRRQRSAPDPHHGSLLPGDLLDVPRVAARLHLTTRRVRRLLSAGERPPRTGTRCRLFLVGEHARETGSVRPGSWVVRRSEVERFEAARRATKARPGFDLMLRPPKSVSLVERRTRFLRRASKRSKPLQLTASRPVQRERRPPAARSAGSDAHGTVNHASGTSQLLAFPSTSSE